MRKRGQETLLTGVGTDEGKDRDESQDWLPVGCYRFPVVPSTYLAEVESPPDASRRQGTGDGSERVALA